MKLASVVASFVLLISTAARADIIPPDVAACGGDRKPGDPCEMFGGGQGVCVESTCSRVLPSGEESYACTRCAPRPEPTPETTPPAETKPAETTVVATKSSKCDAGGAEGLLALGAALVLVARRARRAT
ncbi:MAG: hypothetical protein IT385_02310 [Deltaproteobacteria bacterium]|nr:hypothetical protein [Deltaproteobacteria bacterium]